MADDGRGDDLDRVDGATPDDLDGATPDELDDLDESEVSLADDVDHRGGFGDFGGASGGLIERTFRERIVLVGVTVPPDREDDTDRSLDELAALVDTAGAD